MRRSALCVAQALARAESQINLLARSHPTNWHQLHASVTDDWHAGRALQPRLQFLPLPDFSELRRALGKIEVWAVDQGAWGRLWAARSSELSLEAEMAEQLGTHAVRALAQRRFQGGHEASAESLRRLARRWAFGEPASACDVAIRSDDEHNGESLASQMRRELEKHQWPFTIRFDGRLAAHGAVDDKFVWIKPGVLLRRFESKRIVVHEVHGHVARRAALRSPNNRVYQCGFAGVDADEEGRALWLEEKAGLLDASRRVELGRRHLAADACRQGADFREAVQLLIEIGTSLDQSISTMLRVWRGGGIAREIIYLDAYFRAKRLLEGAPDVDAWLKRGRLTFEVAARLASGDLQPLS